MRIDWAIPCRGFDMPPDGMPNILGAEMNGFRPPELPADIALVIAMKVVAHESELGHPAELSGVVLDPDMGEASARLAMPLTLYASPHKPDGWEQHLVHAIGLRFTANQAGMYSVQFELDGKAQNPISLLVSPQA